MGGKCLKIWGRGSGRDCWSLIGVVVAIYREVWKMGGCGGRRDSGDFHICGFSPRDELGSGR
jgi:hypothetical protein